MTLICLHRPFFLSATSKLLSSISSLRFSKEKPWLSLSTYAPPIHYSTHCSLAPVHSTQLRALLWWRSPRISQFPILMNITSFDIIESLFHSFLFPHSHFCFPFMSIFLFSHILYICILQNSLGLLLFSLPKFTFSHGITDTVYVDS